MLFPFDGCVARGDSKDAAIDRKFAEKPEPCSGGSMLSIPPIGSEPLGAEFLIDVAERMLALQNAGPAATAAEAVRKLVFLGILRSEQPYIDIVRCRIVIVHQYADVDPSIVHQVVTRRLGDFRSFRNEIDAFLAASDR
jgi:hypothetical protein